MKKMILFAAAFLGVAFADTIQLKGTDTIQEGVYIVENSTPYYIVCDPDTGKTTSVEKAKATVTITADHVDLGECWKKAKQAASKLKATSDREQATKSEVAPAGIAAHDDLIEYKDRKGTVVIKHKGDFVPDPAVDERIRQNRQEIEKSMAEDRAARQRAAAEEARIEERIAAAYIQGQAAAQQQPYVGSTWNWNTIYAYPGVAGYYQPFGFFNYAPFPFVILPNSVFHSPPPAGQSNTNTTPSPPAGQFNSNHPAVPIQADPNLNKALLPVTSPND